MAVLKADLSESDATAEPLYLRRREFLKLGAAGALAAALPGIGEAAGPVGQELPTVKTTNFAGSEKSTPWDAVTAYNNFYEFGTSKEDPAKNAGSLRTRPWTLGVDGEVKKAQTLDIDSILKSFPLEERIYRHRCVEAWSMVVPWIGFPLADLIRKLEPTSKAKFVEFQTLFDPAEMPGQKRDVLDWPYTEGLRMDEATHPLTLVVVGLYGRVLPNQNGAPLRMVIPWKYGFKSVKSIVRMRFKESQPRTTWAAMAPNEYGFYANVNPSVDHPRWSQAKERRLGEFFRRETLPFNGYGADVAGLYAGMDPKKLY